MHTPHHPRTLLSVALLALSAGAHAEDETMTVVGKRSQHEEVATATRTNTPAKLVPQAIDSVKASELTAFGQPTLSEALTGIPGVNASGDTRFDGVNIRGFSASNDFYLDGFRDDMQYTRDLGNTERVEVLKGPAAVLYGRGSTGGIVNRVSKKPQKGLESSVSAQVGSFDSRRLAADLNGEAGEQVQVRLNLAQEDKDSFRNGVTSKRTLLAPSVNWEINDKLNWLVQYERNEHDRTPDRGIPGVNGRPADVPKEYVYSDTRRDFIDDVAQSTRSRLTWDINDQWQLRQQLGYTSLDSQFDNTYVTSVKGDQVTRSRWQQDLKANSLISNTEAEGQLQTGPIEHRLLVGFEQNWQERTPKLYQNATAIPAGNLYDPGSLPTYDGAMKLSSDANHKVRGYGLYVQDQLSLGDWHLLAGLRRDDFTVTSRRNDLNKEETVSVTSLSPRLGLVWNPIEEHAFYASYSKTFTPVGGELIGITPGDKNNNLDPQHTRLYEGGVKSDWLDGRLATTLSLYRLEMYNKRSKDPLDPTKVILTGLQRTEGIELSARAQLTDELYLRGGIAIQDAEQVKADADLQGKRPMNVSRQNGELFAGYQSGKQGWFGETGVTAVGDRFADNANTTTLPGYARFDARAGYRWQQWETQLSVENLTDHDYFVSATSASQIMPGTPRQLHLSAAYRF
ncbi:TonB-dependent siderophore receptor [Aeromonas hydrophila]|uniref:TonB-dependent siderophore receptor n=1 Tax=Aeromonas hydrophila TaxID=644 RepID=A0AAX3P6E5_AERHY|nr:TonB-dependent siderophore receptor [Aeromonas hydrophila]HDT5861013.1 TonB-dependent siderophore receptor [Aeromonas hydrophila subsp. hydrophila]MCO4115250.1 TonB-dependent siderophore receptor [Aeromonas hydrophila]MCV9382283.1 TonB-dependent siderophore receptor [Aeromonas hydrophila]ONG01808.1 TonB-dependent siderophore receptor [Aeromonas hydrophila]WEE25723.1 TonB-dependent siderophore receptor [Aeromonas hydrophila]